MDSFTDDKSLENNQLIFQFNLNFILFTLNVFKFDLLLNFSVVVNTLFL